MGLEASNFIPEMDDNNPLGGDPKSEGDDHIRLTKRSVLGSFPAFVGTTGTPKSVSLTEDQINDAALKSAVQTISASWTFGASPTLVNNVPLLGRNVANDGSIEIGNVTVNDGVRIGDDNYRAQLELYALDNFSIALKDGANPAEVIVEGTSRANGSLSVYDRTDALKEVGFRSPTLAVIAAGGNITTGNEAQVLQQTDAAGAAVVVTAMPSFTTLRYCMRGTGTQTLDVSAYATVELYNGLAATGLSALQVPEGNAVELYVASSSVLFVFGTIGVTAS